MRRLIVTCSAAALLMWGFGGFAGQAQADQQQCVDQQPDIAWTCVSTDNHAGEHEDEHTVNASGYEHVQYLAGGFYAYVNCDDDGGTGPAVITTDVILSDPVTLPAQCPTLP